LIVSEVLILTTESIVFWTTSTVWSILEDSGEGESVACTEGVLSGEYWTKEIHKYPINTPAKNVIINIFFIVNTLPDSECKSFLNSSQESKVEVNDNGLLQWHRYPHQYENNRE